MLFNSLAFLLIFLPIVLLVACRIRGQRLLAWITASSFIFYALAGDLWFLAPMLFTTVLDFIIAPLMEKSHGRKRKALLFISLGGNFGLLAYFKYSGLLVRTAEHVAIFFFKGFHPTWSSAFVTLLPAGISFYTFQTLSYIIDVYRGKCPADRNFIKFAGFVSFFPHLIAGPLTRHNQLIPQLERIAIQGIRPRWRMGIYLFSIGLIKKVILADRIAAIIDPLLNHTNDLTFMGGWLVAIGYALQIYFDFSGYTDMAIGIGRLFDIELPQNFNSPYQARNPSDFWRRWHITLSLWLRDYLYISLGGNRCSEKRKNLNLVLTMVLGGLWHGASWTFAIWGLYHGLLLVGYHYGRDLWDRMRDGSQVTTMFLLTCLGWVFFRAESFGSAVSWLRAMFGLNGFGPPSLTLHEWIVSMWLFVVGLTVAIKWKNASSYEKFDELGGSHQVALGIVTFVAILFMNYSSKFLYFQF